MWGGSAEEMAQLEGCDTPLLSITACRVTDFNGAHHSCGEMASNVAARSGHVGLQRAGAAIAGHPRHPTLRVLHTAWAALCHPDHQPPISARQFQPHKPAAIGRESALMVPAGVSVSSLQRSQIRVDPDDLPEAGRLRGWYEAEGRGASTSPVGEGLASAR